MVFFSVGTELPVMRNEVRELGDLVGDGLFYHHAKKRVLEMNVQKGTLPQVVVDYFEKRNYKVEVS